MTLLFSAYLSFHSYSLNLHFPYYAEQSASVNSVLSLAVLFSLYWYLVPQKCREMTVPLSFLFVLSWDDSSSDSSGISDTLDTDDLNTSSSLSSYVNTPSVPHRDVDEQVSHWYQSLMVYRIRNICRSSHEKQLQNIIQFSVIEIVFTKCTLNWFYYFIWLSMSLF